MGSESLDGVHGLVRLHSRSFIAFKVGHTLLSTAAVEIQRQSLRDRSLVATNQSHLPLCISQKPFNADTFLERPLPDVVSAVSAALVTGSRLTCLKATVCLPAVAS